MQMIASLFTLGGVGTTSTSWDTTQITIHYYSSDLIIVFTLIWAFIMGITITQKAYRYSDFAFVSNRFTSNLSNLLFLLTASVVGGISAILVGNVLKVILFFYFGSENSMGGTLLTPPMELILGMFVTSLYILLLSSLGYFFGMLVQLHKGFFVFLLGLFLGIIIFGIRSVEQTNIIGSMFMFFYKETSFLLFMVKTLLTAAILFSCTILISNRMEVRK